MRSLNRNKRDLWYANAGAEVPILDEYGDDTGETRQEYDDPMLAAYNVSAATGEAAAEAFGAFTDYSRVIATAEKEPPLKEGTQVWFGVSPENSRNNYIVVKVADSLNGTLIALREVTV